MKLVILDRDGVINFDSAQFIKSPAEWKPIPGSLEAIAKLNQSGYKVVVATNQSGVGRSVVRHGYVEQHPRKDAQSAVRRRRPGRCRVLLPAHGRLGL
jgi:HAD superfamily hydrolase (TIGR01662 family)